MKLYKYRSNIPRDIRTLVNNKLFAPNKKQLNDPTEMSFDDSEFLNLLGKNSTFSTPVKKGFDDIKHFTQEKNGIFSLSKDVKNELLWAYYANGHKGFCIEYNANIIMESYNYDVIIKDGKLEPNPLIHLVDVDYQDKYPVFSGDLLNKTDQAAALKCLVGTKSKQWKHEKEVRLIFKKYGYNEIDYRAVTGIYFGMRFGNKKKKNEVMQKLQGRGIKYYQMKFLPMSYKMSFDKIEDPYALAPKFIANRLPYEGISIIGIPNNYPQYEKYKKMANKALRIVSKEPCINKIISCRIITPDSNSMIAIETTANKDFKVFKKQDAMKIYRFDINITTNKIKQRKFKPS